MARETPAWLTALLGFVMLVFAMGIGRFAFTPLLPLMQAEGLLSMASGGALASVHFVGYAMGALLAGHLRSFPAATLVSSLFIIGLATLAMGATNVFEIWLVSRWITGVCSALVLVVVSTRFVKQLAELDRSDLQGWVFAGVGGGTAIVGLVTLIIMIAGLPSWLGWQVFGGATIVVCVVVLASTSALPLATSSAEKPSTAARSPLAWQIVLPYGAMGAGYIIPATYLPIMAKEVVSSPFVFGWSWPVFGAAAALSTILSARLYMNFSNRKIWIASQFIMAVGLLVPALWSHISAVIIGGICVGGTFMVITMAGMKEAHRIAGGMNAQALVAAMTAAFAIGQIVGPALAAWAFEATDSFAYPLVLGSVLLVVTLLPMIRLSPEASGANANV